jgi:hypothetical protein
MGIGPDVIKGFYQLFSGLERAHGQYLMGDFNESKGKRDGRASTIATPATEALWEEHFAGGKGLGVIPIRSDNQCYWGAIDVDEYKIDLSALSKKLKKDNIPVIICRTKSGGAHLYLFTLESVPAKLIKAKLLELADFLGYPDSEIFPKQEELASPSDVGNWINMPYYDAEQTTRYAIYDGEVLGVEAFLRVAATGRISLEDLKGLTFEDTSEEAQSLADAPPCIRKLCRTGIPDGGRNKGLFCLGVYCRLKYGDNWETEVNAMNVKYLDPPLGAKEVMVIIKSLNKKKYFYTCNEHPVVGVCNKQICRTKKYGIGGDDHEPPFVLGTLVKIDTDPPTWFIDVDGARVELTTDDLLSQDKFRKLVVEKLNKLPKRLKPIQWDNMVSNRLENVEVVEAPQDTGPTGRFKYLLERFLSRPPGKSEHQLLTGKSIIEGDRVFFRGPDLLAYLEKEKFKGLADRQVWATLRREYKNEITHGGRNIQGRYITLWSLPAPKDIDENIDTPDLTDAEAF